MIPANGTVLIRNKEERINTDIKAIIDEVTRKNNRNDEENIREKYTTNQMSPHPTDFFNFRIQYFGYLRT